MMYCNLIRAALSVAALTAALGAAAQTSPPSESGARKGYNSAQAQENAAARAAPGQLTTASDATLKANAQTRCQALPEGYKEACLERIQGGGEQTGSIEGGGIFRSSETTATLEHMTQTPPTKATDATAGQTRQLAPVKKRAARRQHR